MKTLYRLWFLKTKATLRNLLKKPSSAIFTILVVLFYGFIIGAYLMKPNSMNMNVTFQLHAAILMLIGFLALMLFSTLMSSRKALFNGEDAYFLFSGPFTKRQIMVYLTFQTIIQSLLLAAMALLFFIGMSGGMYSDILFIGLVYLLSVLTIMIFLVFTDYTYVLSIGEKKYKKVTYMIVGLFALAVAVILFMTYLQTGHLQTLLLDFVESDLFYWVPVFGWLKLGLISYIAHDGLMCILAVALLLICLIGIYTLFISYRGDFYEQALSDALELSQRLKEFKSGNQDAFKNIKVKKYKKKPFHDGAYAILSKNLLLMKKKGHLIQISDIISIAIYVVITIFTGLGFGFFVYMMVIWIFVSLQNSDLMNELKNYQIYLIPDRPSRKLVAVMLPTFMKVTVIGAVSFLVMGLYEQIDYLTILMSIINMIGYILIFMSAGVLTIRFLKSRTTPLFENIMRMFLMIIAALPSGILTVVVFMNQTYTPLVLTSISLLSLVMNFLISFLILWACQDMLNGRELKSE